MGANFVIQSIGLKAHADGSVDERWAKSALSQARHAIAAIDQAKLTRISDEHGIVYDDVEAYQRDCRNASPRLSRRCWGTIVRPRSWMEAAASFCCSLAACPGA